MINVSFGDNTVSVYLKDRIDIDPYFLTLKLNFSGQSTLEKIIQVNDINSLNHKACKFEIELVELADEDLNNSKVNLVQGNYNYKFYLNEELGLIDTGKLIKSGLLRFEGSELSEKTFEIKDTEKTLL